MNDNIRGGKYDLNQWHGALDTLVIVEEPLILCASSFEFRLNDFFEVVPGHNYGAFQLNKAVTII